MNDTFAPDPRDWFRLVGGALLALGFAVLFVRQEEKWGDFPLLLVVLLPAVVLYGLGVIAGRREGEGALGWQAVYLIFGTALGGATMAQLILLLGADSLDGQLEQSLVYFTIAALAFVAAFLRGVGVLTFVGGVAALFGWVALLGEVASIDSADTYRVLILVYAALMLAAALALGAAGRPQAPDLVAVAGLSAIAAALISLAGLARGFNPLGGAVESDVPLPSEAWNVFILAVALALIAYGTRARTRGPAYVGALGLFAFVAVTGSHLVALAHGETGARPGVWPLVLIVLGAIVAALGFLIAPGGIAAFRGQTPPAAPPAVHQPSAAGWPQVQQPPPGPAQPGAMWAPPPPRDETAERQRPHWPPPPNG